jgi:tRNA(fMet)-specific endonuclease VapC
LEQADEVFVPSVALGELYYGARKSGRVAQNLAKIDEFAASSAVLSCAADTAKEYGVIKSGLRAKGRPIPENDIWIAALARQYGLILATRDIHFEVIDKLEREVW